MNQVTVKKEELRSIVALNRDKHRSVFLKALDVYRQRAIDEIERWLDDAKNGRKIRRQLGLIEPVDYTHEYDRILKMLDMSVEDEITLTAADFAKFVMDDWAWKEHFTASTAAYVQT